LAVLIAAGGLWLWMDRAPDPPPVPATATADPAWTVLDPQARCDAALTLVTHPDRWPTRCRWRTAADVLQGQSFPPPKGDPPFDEPHVEMYVAADQSRDELAHAIAHEYGHMHHTREPDFVAAWLQARGLPADTPSEVWTEDYAEAFAAVFSPPSDQWRAPTPRPSPEALAALEAHFFS
jgi:hypothetical protein